MRKQLSPVEVARAAFERIAAWENKIKSLDEVGALAQGVLSEARWHAGEALSPLDGVPITIKGNIAVKGIPTPVGTAAADMTLAATDAPPAARVREVGCIHGAGRAACRGPPWLQAKRAQGGGVTSSSRWHDV
jgi:aspartyl-tRNA(Asn)/glutamyl-tRNA(Gln) amidotransferase subunit A